MKRAMSITIFLMLVVAAGYGGVRLYKSTHDPLVVGVPPRHNDDGTVDFTLIGAGGRIPGNLHPLNEWVVRISGKNAVVNGGVVLPGEEAIKDFVGKKNSWIGLRYRFDDMTPVTNFDTLPNDRVPDSPEVFDIHLDSLVDYSSAKSWAESVRQYCKPAIDSVPDLKEFAPNPSDVSCRDGDAIFLLFDKINTDKLLAKFVCSKANSFCDYRIIYRNRDLTGFVGFDHKNEFPAFVARVTDYFDKATLVDRIYSGTPFVSQR
jgi:hypothetical protein